MEHELMAIAATIQAAEIQASATKLAAIYGGVALGVGVFASWLTSLHLQKVTRLAETRRDIYLELVASYSNMVNVLYVLPYDLEKRWVDYEQKVIDFSHVVDKVMFICETKTKEHIFEFVEIFKNKYTDLNDMVAPILVKIGEFNLIKGRHLKTMESFDLAVNEIEKMQLDEIDGLKVQRILDFMKDKIKKVKNYKLN